MTKTEQALLALASPLGNGPNAAKIAANLVINDVNALLGEADITIRELRDWRPDMIEALQDIVFLRSHDWITANHTKTILPLVWTTPYLSVSDVLRDTKLLNEIEGDELDQIVRSVLEENPEVVKSIKGGKPQAVGSLIGKVMKKVKSDPKKVRELLDRMIAES